MPQKPVSRETVSKKKTKSRKQVGLLLSEQVSPQTEGQRAKLKRELESGEVKVRG